MPGIFDTPDGKSLLGGIVKALEDSELGEQIIEDFVKKYPKYLENEEIKNLLEKYRAKEEEDEDKES